MNTEPIAEDLIMKRAHELARVCGCRNWRYHFAVARAQLEIKEERRER